MPSQENTSVEPRATSDPGQILRGKAKEKGGTSRRLEETVLDGNFLHPVPGKKRRKRRDIKKKSVDNRPPRERDYASL